MRIRGSFWVILKLAVVGNENKHIEQDDNDRPSYVETKAIYFLKVYLSGDERPWKILLLYSKSIYQWFTSPCRMKKKKKYHLCLYKSPGGILIMKMHQQSRSIAFEPIWDRAYEKGKIWIFPCSLFVRECIEKNYMG